MPVESRSSSGVARVAAGSRITHFGTDERMLEALLHLARGSVIPACGENSAADSVVGMAIMRSALRIVVPGARFEDAVCDFAQALRGLQIPPQRDQHHLRRVDHRAAADRDDQIGLGCTDRLRAGDDRRAGAVCGDVVELAREPRPSSAIMLTASSPSVSDRVVVTNTRRALGRSSSLASACWYGTPKVTRCCAGH